MSKQLQLINLPRIDPTYYENQLYFRGMKLIAGLDEVGRGCLAGPVFAAAVILDSKNSIEGIKDSKKLSAKKRELLFDEITTKSVSFSIASLSSCEIDRMNILRASLEAMRQAVEQLKIKPDYLLIDGHEPIKTDLPQKVIKRGDAVSISIGAASIIAKVSRDRFMIEMEKQYPQFSFSVHKGYGTALHLEELKNHGPSPIHRMTFSPVREIETMSCHSRA